MGFTAWPQKQSGPVSSWSKLQVNSPPSDPAFVDAMLMIFHLSRIAFGILLILVLYRFVALFLLNQDLRWLALILVCLGAGFGWLLLPFGDLFGATPVDLNFTDIEKT